MPWRKSDGGWSMEESFYLKEALLLTCCQRQLPSDHLQQQQLSWGAVKRAVRQHTCCASPDAQAARAPGLLLKEASMVNRKPDSLRMGWISLHPQPDGERPSSVQALGHSHPLHHAGHSPQRTPPLEATEPPPRPRKMKGAHWKVEHLTGILPGQRGALPQGHFPKKKPIRLRHQLLVAETAHAEMKKRRRGTTEYNKAQCGKCASRWA